jgi:CRISPR-associated protein Csm2
MRAEGKYGIEKLKKVIEENKLKEELTDENILKPQRYAYSIAEEVKNSLKASQLRKIFAQVMEIKKELEKNSENYKAKIWELYPRLAYARGRNLIPKNFHELFVKLLEQAENDKEIANKVVKLIQSIVAYHKLHNPKS